MHWGLKLGVRLVYPEVKEYFPFVSSEAVLSE